VVTWRQNGKARSSKAETVGAVGELWVDLAVCAIVFEQLEEGACAGIPVARLSLSLLSTTLTAVMVMVMVTVVMTD
jgi:hypothetical protein